MRIRSRGRTVSDLTLEEKTNGAVDRAREVTAEKHFFDQAQPFFPLGFSVGYRNPGHWDVFAQRCPGRASAWKHAHPKGFTTESDNERERAFAIRGEPGNVLVRDERWNPHAPFPRESLKFRSVIGAMLWICEELMREPADG
jgi:hypothetical protein